MDPRLRGDDKEFSPAELSYFRSDYIIKTNEKNNPVKIKDSG